MYGPIDRRQVLARVDGVENGRYYDGLFPQPDCTYTAIEVKSGDAKLTGPQKRFDQAVSPENPACATLNGKQILITKVILSDRA